MKVAIDADGCIGCGLCVSTCPEVYKMEEDKETHDEPDEDDEDLGDEDLGGGEKKKKKVIDLGDEPMFAKKGGKGKKDCKKGKCESTIDDE